MFIVGWSVVSVGDKDHRLARTTQDARHRPALSLRIE
jgi:hypothetical protein